MGLYRFVPKDVFLNNQHIPNQGSKLRHACLEKEVIRICLHVCDTQYLNICDIPESK